MKILIKLGVRGRLAFAFITILSIVALFVVSSDLYFTRLYRTTYPQWFSTTYWEARNLFGMFRRPPNSEEMIEHFRLNRTEFEKIIDAYYSNEYLSYAEDINGRKELLEYRAAALGVERILADGPFFNGSARGGGPFQKMGVRLDIFDRYGLPGKGTARYGYIYAPSITGKDAKNGAPILNYLKTGVFFLDKEVPEKVCIQKQTQYLCCGMQVISDNWAVSYCLNADK